MERTARRIDLVPDRLLGRLVEVVSKDPVRWAFYVGGLAFVLGGALFSLVEDDADLVDGWYWAAVVMPTVGFGDFAPETIAGRWLYMYVVASGWFATLVLGGALAGRITERRITAHDQTPELTDDFDHLIEQLQALRSTCADERVVAALHEVHADRAATAGSAS